MNYQFGFFLLTSFVIIAGIIPFGLSQVGQTEPSMEIDMLAGQTQNPFRIQDENDANVFCIDPQGRIACGGTSWVEYSWKQQPNTVITINDAVSPLVLWQLDITDSTPDPVGIGLITRESVLAGEGRWISGTGQCYLLVQYTINDGSSWVSASMDISTAIFSDTPWNFWYDFWFSDRIAGGVDGVRLITFNDAGVTCEMRDVARAMDFLANPDLTITQTTYYE